MNHEGMFQPYMVASSKTIKKLRLRIIVFLKVLVSW